MMEQFRVDAIINTLWGKHHLYGRKTVIRTFEWMIGELCPVSRDIFLKEPNLLQLKAPIRIAGDLHGHYTKLQSIFKYGGPPPHSNYLFLGNYVDRRGDYLLTVLLLLALKIKYPENVFLLKGGLDDAGIEPLHVDEIDEKDAIDSSSMQILHDCLTSLPVAALINDKIICTHGGLSPRLHNLDQIRHTERYTNLPYSSLLSDLLGTHPRRYGDVLVVEEAEFLEKHDLRLVCCGRHQAVSNYKDFAEHRVVVLSSACGRPEFHNTSKVSDNTTMSVDVNLMCSFHKLGRKRVLWSYHILMAGTIQPECSSGVNLVFRTTTTTTTNTYGEDSPFRKGSGSSIGGTECDSKSVTNPSKFDFDASSILIQQACRSKSPGVKRFLGARV